MRASKAVGMGVAALQLVGLVVFALSFHTLFSIMSTALSGEAITFTATLDEAAGELRLDLGGDLRNDGLLGADLHLEAGIPDAEGEYIASDSTSVHLGAGEMRSVSLSLTVPAEVVEGWQAEGGGTLDVTFRIRTLQGLVGFSNALSIRMEGGR